MRYTTVQNLLSLLIISSCLCLGSCGDSASTQNDEVPTQQTDSSTATKEPIKENARTLSTDAISGTYVYKDQDSPEGGGYLAIQKLENGRLKFELDINNGPPNYHSGTATGEMELDGNKALFTTSEYAMEGQDPCVISFLFVDNMIELKQKQGADMSCGFGQGVIAHGIYTKKNDSPVFRYEGGQ